MLKKIAVLVVVAAGAVLAKKRLDQSSTEKALWAEATDRVK